MYNIQKANSLKRISALILDFILLFTVTVGCAYLITIATGYDTYATKYENLRVSYGEQYGVKLDITNEEYAKLTEEQKALYDEAQDAFSKDEEAKKALSTMTNLLLLTVNFSLLFAFLILEFLVPLFLRNGQTIGKKIFAIGVIQSNSVKLPTVGLFIRTILGKYTVGTMIPLACLFLAFFGGAGILGLLMAGAVVMLNFILASVTANKTAIHDVFAGSVVVDLSCQMMFDSYDEMMAYKQRLHNELVDKSPY